MRPRPTALISVTLLVGALGVGQRQPSPESPQSTFEVASIRPNNSGETNSSIRPYLNGQFDAENASVRDLIVYAYGIPEYGILGGPSWVSSKRYDIQARLGVVEHNTSMEQFEPRLQALLADRFKLLVHRETQRGLVYWLTRDKKGLKLRESTGADCAAPNLERQSPSPEPNGRPVCGYLTGHGGHVSGSGVHMNTLTQALSRILRITVVDKTGLPGQYNVRLEWTPDEAPPPSTVASSDVTGPSIFTAIGEQLGLKLVPKKVPVEVIVIDHVDQPSAN